MAKSKDQPSTDAPDVSWPDIIKFVRQLSHDIRNNLNAVELQSAYLAELAQDEEMKNEIQRLRGMVSEIGVSLQLLTAGLSMTTPNLIPYPAADFIDDMKQKLAKELGDNAAKISWDVQLKNAQLEIDPQLVQQAFLELFTNAFQHERNVKSITAKIYVDPPSPGSGATGSQLFVLELQEPKAKFELSTANWGREPLRNVSQGHYGLGLNRARAVAEAHGGELSAEYDRKASLLLTKLTLPLAAKTP